MYYEEGKVGLKDVEIQSLTSEGAGKGHLKAQSSPEEIVFGVMDTGLSILKDGNKGEHQGKTDGEKRYGAKDTTWETQGKN